MQQAGKTLLPLQRRERIRKAETKAVATFGVCKLITEALRTLTLVS